MADIWRCSRHRKQGNGNLPGISLRVGIAPACVDALAGILMKSLPASFPVTQLKREANERRRNGPGRLEAGEEIAGDLRYTANPPSLTDGDLQCRQTRGCYSHQHFQVLTIRLFPHAEASEFVPPDGAKR